jgi:hypothetical protein
LYKSFVASRQGDNTEVKRNEPEGRKKGDNSLQARLADKSWPWMLHLSILVAAGHKPVT